ncbi:MAG: hypothetical protein ACRES6_08935 [Steroidobacteraceae bacterium]
MAKKDGNGPAAAAGATDAGTSGVQACAQDSAGAPAAEPARTHVYMKRDAQQYRAPHRAHVHVDEVANYATGGWELE